MSLGAITVDFEPLKTAIWDWLNQAVNAGAAENASTSIPILRAEQGGARPTTGFIEYKFLTGLVKHGMSDEIIPKEGDPILFSLRGQRSLTISVNIVAENAFQCMAQIQQSLSSPVECGILRAAGLSVFNDEAFSDASLFQETAVEGRAVFDVTFGYCLSTEIDPGLIETVNVQGEIGPTPNGFLKTNQSVDKFAGDISGILASTGDAQVTPFPVGKGAPFQYGVIAALQNLVDTDPIFVPVGIIKKTNKSFTGIWSGTLDTANYNIEYIARVNQMASLNLRAGSELVYAGQDEVFVQFQKLDVDSPDEYVVVPTLSHESDLSPILVPMVVSQKTDKSFKVKLPTNLGDGYRLEFIAKKNSENLINGKNWRSGSVAIPDTATSQAITFGTAFSGLNYAGIPAIVNTVDADPKIQNLVIGAKTAAGFTTKWPSGVDSANYKLEYIAREND